MTEWERDNRYAPEYVLRLLEFLGLWETLHNPDFKPVEFDGFRKEAGLHAFTMSPSKWIESVNAIGITTKAGRYGGTYAFRTIAKYIYGKEADEYHIDRVRGNDMAGSG